MARKRLLERIRDQEYGTSTRGKRHVPEEIQSIIDHLLCLLNARQGSTVIAEDYGIPDFTNLSGDDYSAAMSKIIADIKNAIEKYENRLENVKVTVDPDKTDPFTVRFKLEGLLSGEKEMPVIFETLVSSVGRIIVNSSH
jgi:type VI secretion system protein